jgi:membrane peptidoglycan carboxypeptidase
MSNKLLEMFDWANAPIKVVEAGSSPGGDPSDMKPAAVSVPARNQWWTKQRLILVARRVALVSLAWLCLFLGGLGWLWNTTPSTADLVTRARAQLAAHHAPYTPLAAIAPTLSQAVVAIEDERFYQHHGIDTVGLARAGWDDLRAGRFAEGGSTITAQLAKLVYLHGYDHTIPLKAQDLVLALKIEQRYSKGQIMEMYLNVAYYGENAYGIAAAAQHFFGVKPARLDLAQSALLAGLLQAPGAYDPWCHTALARSRQQAVLARMVVDGDISPAQANLAANQVLPFWASPLGQHAACAA